jgi:FHS family glucose/mannose:H+ symporter-like MFS transporter
MKKTINAICYISLLFLGMYLAVYQITISSISEEHVISSTISGVLISLHFAGIMLAPAIFGEISDRRGKKPVVIISFIIFITGLLLVYFFDLIVLIAVGIFLIGCGFGVIEGLLSGLLADINVEKTSQVINISQMYFSIGAVIGPVVAVWIIDTLGGWKQNYIVLTVIFFLLLLVILKLDFGKVGLAETEESKVIEKSGPISLLLLKQKTFFLLCLSIFVYVGIEEASAFWVNTYFRDVLNTEKLGAYALSGYWGSMAVGRYIGSKFEEKSNMFVKAGLWISLISLTLGLIIRNPVVNLVCFTLLGFGFSVVWPVIVSITAKKYPQYTGTSMGIIMTSGAIGGIIVPFLTGVAAELAGIAAALMIIPVLTLIILFIVGKIEKY